MKIANLTETPRALPWKGGFITIAPMSSHTLPNDNDTKQELARLKNLDTFKILLDMRVFAINEDVTPRTLPTEIEGPKPPAELIAEPENPRVTVDKPRKTKETVKV